MTQLGAGIIDPGYNQQRKFFISTTLGDSPETFGMKIRIESLDLIVLTLVTFALLPETKAVVPGSQTVVENQ